MYLPIRASCGLLLPQFLLFADIQKWFRMAKKFRQLPEFLLAVLSFLPAGLNECTFQEKVSKISISEAFVGNLIVNYFCGREHKKLEGKPTFVSPAQDPEDFCARAIDLPIRIAVAGILALERISQSEILRRKCVASATSSFAFAYPKGHPP